MQWSFNLHKYVKIVSINALSEFCMQIQEEMYKLGLVNQAKWRNMDSRPWAVNWSVPV